MNKKQCEIKFYEYNAHFKYKELYSALSKLQIDKEYQNNNEDNLNKKFNNTKKINKKDNTKTNLKNLNKNKSQTNKHNNIISRNVELDNYVKNLKLIQKKNDLDLKAYCNKTYINNNNDENTIQKNRIYKINKEPKKCNNNINIVNIEKLKKGKKKKSPPYNQRPPCKNMKNNLMLHSLFIL